MIKHIVLFNLPPELKEKNNVIQTLKDKLERLKNKIPQLKKLETGINIGSRSNAFDLALVTEFENENDLEIYRNHPDHQSVVDYITEVKAVTVVADYII